MASTWSVKEYELVWIQYESEEYKWACITANPVLNWCNKKIQHKFRCNPGLCKAEITVSQKSQAPDQVLEQAKGQVLITKKTPNQQKNKPIHLFRVADEILWHCICLLNYALKKKLHTCIHGCLFLNVWCQEGYPFTYRNINYPSYYHLSFFEPMCHFLYHALLPIILCVYTDKYLCIEYHSYSLFWMIVIFLSKEQM